MPQPDAPLEYHLVGIVSESLPNGASGERACISQMHLRPPFGKDYERIVTRWSSQVNDSNKHKSKNKKAQRSSFPTCPTPPSWQGFSTRCGPHSSKHISPPVIGPLTLQPQLRMPRALEVLKAQCLKPSTP